MGKILLLLVSLAGLSAASFGVSAQERSCNRACLAEMLDQYLNAIVAREPAKAPLFAGFRQTENSIVVRQGQGLWRTSTGLGAVQRRFLDPVTGSAAYYGLIEEGEGKAIVTMRMRVQNRQITEAEWLIGRPSHDGMMGDPGKVLIGIDYVTANPPPQRVVPIKDRVPREQLIAAVNSYFDGITNHDPNIIQAHPGCVRLENGALASGRPLPAERPNDGGLNGMGDCRSGTSGFDVALVAARRYHMVDEEAQTVVASAVFIRTPGVAKRRNHFMDIFYLDGGLVRALYASMFYVPPTQPVPHWPPYDSNFPLAPSFGPGK
jgi:hypothetical protein